MRTHAALLALLLLLAPAAAHAQAAGTNDVAALERRVVELGAYATERTVLVFGLIGLGSGAVVDHAGTVVTNAHVVAGARYALVQWADGRTVLARRRGIDYARDLAVLEPEQPLARPVPAFALAAGRPAPGSWVVAAGYPGGLRTTPAPTISLGRVLEGAAQAPEVLGVLDYGDALRTDVPIFSGNSGGPLIDLEGRLVGINGAVELERAVSMTIPIDAVRERLADLQGGVILLPGGRRLDPGRNPVLRSFFRATDAIARQLPQRVAEASRQALEGDALAELDERLGDLVAPRTGEDAPGEALARMARALPRQAALARGCAFREVPGLLTDDGLHLTPIDHLHAVAKASLLGERTTVAVGGRPAQVIATAEADDLALLRLPDPIAAVSADAPLRPVGSVAWVRGREGLIAAGIVSVDARPTSASVLARIQQGGVPEQVEGLLELAEQLGERLRIEPLAELVEQVRAALEARRGFAAGTPPRSYPCVLSIDAPTARGA